MDKDFLVVGGGIAGSVLALKLKAQGFQIDLVDNHFKDNATKIAAGMINPVNFKRMITCWNAEDFLEQAIPFYKNLEADWGVSFLKDVSLAKLMNSDHEDQLWKEGCEKDQTKHYLNSEYISSQYQDLFKFDHSVGEVNGIYQLETEIFLSQVQNYLSQENSLFVEQFNFDDLTIQNEGLMWKERTYKKVVFAEGMGIVNNPYFNYLPFKATKGDLIKVKTDFDLKHTIKKNIFFHPEGNQEYWVGATYDWNDLSWEPSDKGRDELVSKLEKIAKFDYEILEQKAGVRPTVKDRRPYLGSHRDHHNLFVFNGLGTRGVLMAPLLADHLIDHILNGKALMDEVNISRIEN